MSLSVNLQAWKKVLEDGFQYEFNKKHQHHSLLKMSELRARSRVDGLIHRGAQSVLSVN